MTLNPEKQNILESKPGKFSSRQAYFLGIAGFVFTILVAIAVIYFWEYVRALAAYGYSGVFVISVFGGATVLAPIPMTPVVFAMGGVLSPWLVGIVAGLGETVGGIAIYMTGYGSGAAFYYNTRNSTLRAIYTKLMKWVEQRGSITLFLLSAIINPFFYPAALAAGAARFGMKKYFFVCLAGKIIKGFTVAYAGYWGLRGLMRLLGLPF